MITKAIATALRHGAVIHHRTEKNADGTPLRVRVSGRCQTWKTRPEDFRLPVKYGMYQSLAITPANASDYERA